MVGVLALVESKHLSVSQKNGGETQEPDANSSRPTFDSLGSKFPMSRFRPMAYPNWVKPSPQLPFL